MFSPATPTDCPHIKRNRYWKRCNCPQMALPRRLSQTDLGQDPFMGERAKSRRPDKKRQHSDPAPAPDSAPPGESKNANEAKIAITTTVSTVREAVTGYQEARAEQNPLEELAAKSRRPELPRPVRLVRTQAARGLFRVGQARPARAGRGALDVDGGSGHTAIASRSGCGASSATACATGGSPTMW